MPNVRIRPEAEEEIAWAAAYIDGARLGYGARFVADLDRVVARIAEAPDHFTSVQGGVRRALLRKFPYAVYFSLDGDEGVVLAVLHLHRRPDVWQLRQP